MKRCVMTVLVAVCVAITGVAFAAPVTCTGTVNDVTIGTGGEVYIKTSYFPTDSMRLCSLEYEWQDAVGEKTCAAWFRVVQDAFINGKQVVVKYHDITQTCATLPTWSSSHVPEYVRIK